MYKSYTCINKYLYKYDLRNLSCAPLYTYTHTHTSQGVTIHIERHIHIINHKLKFYTYTSTNQTPNPTSSYNHEQTLLTWMKKYYSLHIRHVRIYTYIYIYSEPTQKKSERTHIYECIHACTYVHMQIYRFVAEWNSTPPWHRTAIQNSVTEFTAHFSIDYSNVSYSTTCCVRICIRRNIYFHTSLIMLGLHLKTNKILHNHICRNPQTPIRPYKGAGETAEPYIRVDKHYTNTIHVFTWARPI